MKKRIVALFLLLAMVFTACGTPDTPVTSSTDVVETSSEEQSGAPVFEDGTLIVENGKSEYKIVRNKDGADYETDYAIDLQNRINQITGAQLKLVSDTKEEAEFEILIGSARGANEGLAENEYIIKFENGKLSISAGGEGALREGYEVFLNDFLGCNWNTTEYEKRENLALPETIDLKGKKLTREEYLQKTQLIKYPEYPEEDIIRDYDYSVRVTQGNKSFELPVYNQVVASNYFSTIYNGDQHRRFSEFAFGGDPVTIEVTVNMDFNSAVVMPASAGIDFKVNGNVITYTLDKPMTTMVKINGDIDTVLSIFAEEPEYPDDIPNKNAPNVVYYEAGVHRPENGVVRLETGQELYLEPGAVLYARVRVEASAGNKISGRGAIVEPSPTRNPVDGVNYMIQISETTNVEISGIKILDAHTFNIHLYQTSNIEIDSVKILSNQISTDGVTMLGIERNVHIKDCFLYNSDDVFVYCGNLENVVVDNCIIGSGYGIFTPTLYDSGSTDTYFRDCTVFRCGKLLKVMNSVSKDTPMTYMENICLEDCDTSGALIEMVEGTEAYRNFYFKNISIRGVADTTEIFNTKGNKYIAVTCENVWINGKELNGQNHTGTASIGSSNKLTYVKNFDKESAKVGINTTKKVTAYTAEKVYIADLKVETPIPSFAHNGTRYVPAKEILVALDFENVKVSDNTLSFSYDGKSYSYKAGTDGIMQDGHFCVPLSFFEKIGTSATYNSSQKRVDIKNIKRQGNLLRNPGLEEGMTTDWTTRWFTPMFLSTDAHSGKYAMRMCVTPDAYEPSSSNGIYQDVADVVRRYGSGTYKLSCWVKKAEDCDSTYVSLGITQYYDPGKDKVTVNLTDEWQKIELTYTFGGDPADLSTLYFFVGYANGSIKNILIDDMVMERQ